ncbi:MAG: hypothetical protein IJ806_04625 [Ruminococcus sp.]|nr:hypothetical protein [Ruminococcus sp.]
MLNFKCRNCGGEMSVDRRGDLLCSYCDSRFVFTDRDLKDYKEFRYKMLYYLSAVANKTAADSDAERIWESAEGEQFETADGTDIVINHIYMGRYDGVEIYTARNSVVFVFPSGCPGLADRFGNSLKCLSYPSADVRDLSQYFPHITGQFTLKDGRMMLAVSKPENVFPLGAFGSLPPVHAAWITSRLENLCCVLEYSGVMHGGIDLESLFINAGTHELYLLGGWWKSRTERGVSDLHMVRNTVKKLMGRYLSQAPGEYRRFLDSVTAKDAYDDFAQWDQVIQKGFGGRRFEKLDLTDIKI